MVCTNTIVGPKFMPACVRGYANRRPGIFYTFYVNFRIILFDFGSTSASSFANFEMRLVIFVSKFAHCLHK